MRILIRNRSKLISHQPKTWVLLPFSTYGLCIFATKIYIYDLINGKELIGQIDYISEPAESFTVELDLEKGHIACHGIADSFFRMFIAYDAGKIIFNLSRPLAFNIIQDDQNLIVVSDNLPKKTISSERIAFGIFKKQQNIELREDVREILPLWHAIAKQMPEVNADFSKPSILRELKNTQDRESVVPLFKALFRTGFHPLFFPSMTDQNFRGYKLPPLQGTSPLALISEGATIIRSLLFNYENQCLNVLPMLPKELESGRMTGCRLADDVLFDLEWRSGKLVAAAFTALKDTTLKLTLPKGIKSFRSRKENCFPENPIFLEKGAYVFLDRFLY